MSDIVSLRLLPEVRERLDALAAAMERSRASIAAEAVAQYLDQQAWQIAAIKKGIDAADRGELLDHKKLKAKWEKRLAAEVDRAR